MDAARTARWPLASVLVERLGASLDDGALVALEAALAHSLATGRAAWPQVQLEGSHFVLALAGHLRAGSDLVGAVKQLDAAGLYLTTACAQGLAPAVAQLDRLIGAESAAAVVRMDPSPAFAAEVAQSVRIKLLGGSGQAPRCVAYSGRGSLQSWLRVTALRAALDLRRTAKPAEPLDALADLPAPASSPELGLIRDRYRGDFKEAFRQALGCLDSRERTLLRLHHLDQLGLAQIGAHYRVHRTTVASWLARARQKLLDDTRRLLGERLALSRAEVDSLIQLLGSQLSVSIQGVRGSSSD